MTRDEILKILNESDLRDENGFLVFPSMYLNDVIRFANLVAAHEREGCLNCYSPDDTATDWADKIRARGQE